MALGNQGHWSFLGDVGKLGAAAKIKVSSESLLPIAVDASAGCLDLSTLVLCECTQALQKKNAYPVPLPHCRDQ